jgi:hypothetical protein
LPTLAIRCNYFGWVAVPALSALVLSALGAVTSTVLVSDTTSAVLLGSVAAGWLEQEASRAPSAKAGAASHSGRQESGFIRKTMKDEERKLVFTGWFARG